MDKKGQAVSDTLLDVSDSENWKADYAWTFSLVRFSGSNLLEQVCKSSVAAKRTRFLNDEPGNHGIISIFRYTSIKAINIFQSNLQASHCHVLLTPCNIQLNCLIGIVKYSSWYCRITRIIINVSFDVAMRSLFRCICSVSSIRCCVIILIEVISALPCSLA